MCACVCKGLAITVYTTKCISTYVFVYICGTLKLEEMYTLSKLRRTASYPASLLQPSEFMLSATRPADRCSLLNQAGAAWQHPSARNCCCSHCFMEFIVRVLFSLREKLARSSQVTFSETRQLCLSRAGSTHITLASTRAAGLLTPSREVARLFPGTAACKNRKDDTTEQL